MYLARPKKVVLRATHPQHEDIYACSISHLFEELKNRNVDTNYWRLQTKLNPKSRRLKKEINEEINLGGWNIQRLNSTISSRR